MHDFLLSLGNLFFYAFHTVLILFNLFGWLRPRWRKLNLITLLVTFFSWGILGLWQGWGYCFLTDWHYTILRQLGHRDLPTSYIAFLVKSLTGWLPPADLVNSLTLLLAVLALICSLWVNYSSRSFTKR